MNFIDALKHIKESSVKLGKKGFGMISKIQFDNQRSIIVYEPGIVDREENIIYENGFFIKTFYKNERSSCNPLFFFFSGDQILSYSNEEWNIVRYEDLVKECKKELS